MVPPNRGPGDGNCTSTPTITAPPARSPRNLDEHLAAVYPALTWRAV
jgi:hypothetical protein